LVRQAGRQLRHGLEALGAEVELLQPLGVGDVGEDRGDAGRAPPAPPAPRPHRERGGRDADGERAGRPPRHRFHPHRPPPPASASRSAPIAETRLARYAVMAPTTANSPSCIAIPGPKGRWCPKTTSAK